MYNFFSGRCNLELLGAAGGGLFCLGGYMGKGFNLGSFKEKRVVFGKQMFPLSFKERVH